MREVDYNISKEVERLKVISRKSVAVTARIKEKLKFIFYVEHGSNESVIDKVFEEIHVRINKCR